LKNQHSPALKAEVALEALRDGESIARLADRFQVDAEDIECWKQRLLTGMVHLFAPNDEHAGVERTDAAVAPDWEFALAAAEIGAWELDLVHGSAWRSRRHDQIFGYAELLETWTYAMFLEHVVEEDRSQVDSAFERALAEGQPWDFECRARRCNGDVVWIAARGRANHDEHGHPTRMWGTVQDITARKRAEESLRSSEERLRLALDAADLATWDLDLTTDVATRSLRHDQIWGYSSLQPEWGNEIAMRHVVPEDRAAVEAAHARALETGVLFHENRVRWSDGSIHWIAVRGRLHRDDQGKPLRIAGVVADVTERARAEEALRQANARLVDSDRRKDEFIATLAHEVRNPLAPIQTGLELLQLSPPQPPMQRVLEMMTRQMAHLGRLVDDLLDISRITRGKVSLRPERVDLNEVVARALEEADPALSAGGLCVVTKLPQQGLVVRADRVRLVQVVANLLDNAAKFTSSGGQVWVELGREAGNARLTVRDDGIGLAPELLAEVFETFKQVDESTQGLGIGLALVRSLVGLHGGAVEARSEGPGHGTEFIIRLPSAAPGAATESNATSAEHNPPRPAARALPAVRALVVDDNVDAAETLGMLLQALGADARVAGGGGAALSLLDDFQPTVVFLDLGMPGMNGFEVAQRIRATDGGRSVLLVAVSGWGQPDDHRRSRLAGFDRHLVKPVSIADLEDALLGARPA
jgi:PAS domain S-box-containing protein